LRKTSGNFFQPLTCAALGKREYRQRTKEAKDKMVCSDLEKKLGMQLNGDCVHDETVLIRKERMMQIAVAVFLRLRMRPHELMTHN